MRPRIAAERGRGTIRAEQRSCRKIISHPLRFYTLALKCVPPMTADTPSTDMAQLAFFPSSLPDETIYSRISRYHVLAGHRNCLTTYSKLFRRRPFALGEVAPARLSVLVSRIPNAPRGFLGELLRKNTLLPLVMPFLASQGVDADEYANLLALARGFLTPKRQRGDGDMQICAECIRADQEKFGCGYWHRSHQLPAVTACWRHGTKLLCACPSCGNELSPRELLLRAPWRHCSCGNNVAHHTGEAACQAEIDFAHYAKAMLDDKVRKFPARELEKFYCEFLSERSSWRSFTKAHASQRMLLSLLLERHRESHSGLNPPKLSISSMPNKAFAPCACGVSALAYAVLTGFLDEGRSVSQSGSALHASAWRPFFRAAEPASRV